jgi:L-methionine (R)-S-oxide reductase
VLIIKKEPAEVNRLATEIFARWRKGSDTVYNPPMDREKKRELYREVSSALRAVLEGVEDPIAAMASSACLLHERIPYSSWTGFYRVVAPGLLRVGPYQGPLGCLEISFDRGVCGAAARERRTQVVEDVHAFPGHIACDSGTRSEIVVPVFDPGGDLIAVLDLDSHQPAAFDEVDREELEKIAEMLRPSMRESFVPLGPGRAH